MNEKLLAGLQKIGLSFTDDQLSKIETYGQCVLQFNRTYNLMKAADMDELVVNHVLDSLVAVPRLSKIIEKLHCEKKEISIADIGSGGGCPGIPLAVAFPDEKITLVERMEKRCAFLHDAISKMGLKNVTVNCTQADLVPKSSFDIEVFRAFHPFDKKITSLLLSMLKKDGCLVAYKAREEKILAEMEEVKSIVREYEKIKVEVPFLEDHERHLVIIQKPV